MPYCPNCHATIVLDADSCASCGAEFTGNGWRPLEEKPSPPARPSIAGILAKLGIASVVLPALGFLVGLLLSNVIPGCHCDEGAGCRGCGANALVEHLLFGGFVGALGAFIFVLPVSLVLAAFFSIFSNRGS
jgi:hypothetical protein